ncbi:hypothetical protein [Paenibacillus residui]|uniref:Uncharacterized protein n=1 Tax=Paenibacillus residui TaxID=629724 RepID=A0ABW3DET4_9BACL
MTKENKQIAYKTLVNRRKDCILCDPLQCKLQNPSKALNGQLDTDEIGHWTDWQGSLDAKVMVVGQDWGDFKTLEKQGGCDVDNSVTNRSLVKLLMLLAWTLTKVLPKTNTAIYFLRMLFYV